MQANKLTLERHTGRRPGRTHDVASRLHCARTSAGVPITSSSPVVMARSKCVCCLLLMPAIARLWAGWPLSAGISGEMVRDLMVVSSCVEHVDLGSARRRIPSNIGCPIKSPARRTSPRTHSTPQRPWALKLCFHASPLARIQRHRGGIRQNLPNAIMPRSFKLVAHTYSGGGPSCRWIPPSASSTTAIF